MARRRELMRSKHAESARRELLARDRHRPLGEDEIEAELARLQVVFSIEDPTVAINSVSLKLALFAYELSFSLIRTQFLSRF